MDFGQLRRMEKLELTMHDLCEKGARDPDEYLDVLQAINDGRQVSVEAEDWILRLIRQEIECHQAFFGEDVVAEWFDYGPFRAKLGEIGEAKLAEWKDLGLETHFLPPVEMSQDANFPGWKVKPEKWYYEQVAAGKVFQKGPCGELEPVCQVKLADGAGVVVLIDTRCEPAYEGGEQIWENDNLLASIMQGLRQKGQIAKYEHGPQSSRFGVSAKEWEEKVKPALAEELGLELSQVWLETAIQANVISQIYPDMPRSKDGKSNTAVWYEEWYGVKRGDSRYRLIGGRSAYGGLAFVCCGWVGVHWYGIAPRPLAVLS